MSEVRWSRRATNEFLDYLAYLAALNPQARKVAEADISARVERLGRWPMIGHLSRWPTLRELSLSRWRKIVVYRVEPDWVYIVALLDARQDLSAVVIDE